MLFKNKSRFMLIISLLLTMGMLLAACGGTAADPVEEPVEEPAEEPAEEPVEEPAEEVEDEEMEDEEMEDEEMEEEDAAPELGTEDNPFIIAFVPSGDADAVLASGDAIATQVSEMTGLVIEANVPTSYVGAIEAMCAGEAQAVALNTFSYIVASARDCAEVALVSVRFGSPTYAGQIIVRADSGITSIEDLKGKTFCRPDAFSTSGWIIPSITMRAAGLDPDTDLAEIIDAGGHSGTVRSVYNGDCDAGATFVDARGGIAEEFEDVLDVVIVIQESNPIPNDTLSFRPDVPAETRDAITQAFLDIAGDEELVQLLVDLYEWAGLEPIEDSFYDAFRQDLEAAGVDVEDFINE